MLKLSVITPSYNQASFLRQALESIHGQAYPAVEHWVIDGGSTDGSVPILQEYADSGLLQFISEPDAGQSQAINKGFRRLTGDVICWLNSDDLYTPGTLSLVSGVFASHSEVQIVTGDCRFIDPEGRETGIGRGCAATLEELVRVGQTVWQPSTFFRRSLLEQIGLLDESLHYAMDYDFWVRAAAVTAIHYVPRILSCYRVHPGSKTSQRVHETFLPEVCRVSRRYRGSALSRDYWVRRDAVARYAASLYYGAALEARRRGDLRGFRRQLWAAICWRPLTSLYWREWRLAS